MLLYARRQCTLYITKIKARIRVKSKASTIVRNRPQTFHAVSGRRDVLCRYCRACKEFYTYATVRRRRFVWATISVKIFIASKHKHRDMASIQKHKCCLSWKAFSKQTAINSKSLEV